MFGFDRPTGRAGPDVHGPALDARPLTPDARLLTPDARLLTLDARPLTPDAHPLTPNVHRLTRRRSLPPATSAPRSCAAQPL